MNKEEYVNLVCSLGCIITGREAEPHHPRCFGFAAKKAPDWLVIPLCPELHRLDDDSYHKDPALFEMKYGKEVDLLAFTIRAVVHKLSKERLPF